MQKKYIWWVAIGIVCGVLVSGAAVRVRPVYAQGVNQILNLLKGKAGFDYGNNSGFVFTKETPNYVAFAGDRATTGGHRIMLVQDSNEVEFSFLSAYEASASAEVAGAATPSAELTPADLNTLFLAEQILGRQATTSGTIASGSATVIDEKGITPDERLTLASAAALLSATGSAEFTQEQDDFLLYIELQTRKLTQASLAINKDILGAIQEASSALSTAKLEEDEKERKVVFHSIASGIDMTYLLNENGIQQEISIANRDIHTNAFTFVLNTHGLMYQNLGHGSWYFSDSLGYVMRFIHGWVMDAVGKFTNDVTIDITKTNGKDTVTLTVPDNWLSDPSRVYPVTLHTGLEVVPELRTGHPGAAEARALRTHSVVVPTELITPTLIATPSATAIASSSAAPTIIIATPEASDSGVLEGTPSATPTSEASGSGVLNWFNLVPQVYAAEPTQPFFQGVMAVNTDKAVYTPGEQVLVQIASLDAAGHTLCTSNLKLEITDPKKTATDTRISPSPTCGDDNVTDSPDYTALYHVGNVGTYRVRVTDLDTGLVRQSSFEVKERVPFEITRTGATRINPFKSDYKMTIHVKANQNFDGVIKEQIPDNFKVVDSNASWYVHLKIGEEKSFSYIYRAPKISPQLYFLGSLAIGEFRENRQWQIASDASCIASLTGGWRTAATWGSACNSSTTGYPVAGDDVTINGGVVVTVNNADYSATVSFLSTGAASGLTISTGNSLTLTSTLTMNSGGTGAKTVTIAGSGVFTVGNIVMNAPTVSKNELITLTGTAPNLGSLVVNGNGTSANGTISITGGSTGGVTGTASITAADNSVNATGNVSVTGGTVTAALLSATTGSISIGGTATVTSSTAGTAGITVTTGSVSAAGFNIYGGTVNSTVSSTTGTITTTAGVTFTGTASTARLRVTSTGVFNCAGTLGAGSTAVSIAAGSQTNFTGTSYISGDSYTIGGNVEIDSGTTTLNGSTAFTISGTLLVRDGATFNLGNYAYTQTGNVTVGEGASGIMNGGGSNTGTYRFDGSISVLAGGVFDLSVSGGAHAINFRGTTGIDNHGNTFNTGTGAITFNNTGNFPISGDHAITFGGNMSILAGRTIVNSNTAASPGTTFGSLTMPNPSTSASNSYTLSDGTYTTVTAALSFTANTRSGYSQVITMNGSANLDAGSLTINAPAGTGVGNISSSVVCNAGSGTFHVSGAASIRGNATTTGAAILDMQTCTFTVDGLMTITGGTNATGQAIVSLGHGIINFNNGLSFVAGGTITNAVLTTTDAGAVINFAGTLTGAGTLSLTGGTLFRTTGDSTLITAPFTTWTNWEVVSGTTTLGAGDAQTVTGLQVDTGATLANADNLITDNCTGTDVNGFRIDGTLSGTGGITLSNTSSCVIDAQGAGAKLASATGTVTVTSSISVASGANITFGAAAGAAVFTVSSGTVTNNGTVTLANAAAGSGLAGAGGWTNAANSTLNVAGATTTAITITTLTATADPNTVNYTGAAQTGSVTTYNNLTLSGSGAKTFATSPTVNGVLSMEGTATVAVTAGVVTYGSSATLQYNTTTGRTATPEEWISPFAATGGVIIANTGVITLDTAKVFNASVPLTINSGAALTTGNFQLTLNDNFVNNGGTFTAGSSPIVISGTDSSQSIAGFSTTGAVSMTKSSGTATFTGNVTANSLSIDGVGGTLNLGASLSHTINSTVSLSNGILDGGSSAISLTGDWTKTSGSFTASTSTVTLSGATGTTQEISGTNTFFELIANAAGARTIKFPSSTTTTITNSLTLAGSAGPTYLILAPSTASTVWTIAPPATQSIDYVDVSYSTATSCINLTGGHSHDGTNNTLWDFTGGSCSNNAPNAPSLLFANEQANGAQSGELSPVVAIGDATPVLSAVYNDNNAGDHAVNYEIIVYSDACSTQLWDSGEQLLTACDVGNRCQDITYGGTTPLPFDGSTYYWKIKYWDSGGLAGPYSGCTDNFSVVGPANQLRHGNYFFNNATKRVYTW